MSGACALRMLSEPAPLVIKALSSPPGGDSGLVSPFSFLSCRAGRTPHRRLRWAGAQASSSLHRNSSFGTKRAPVLADGNTRWRI
jgi:hypothetical protein